MKKTTLTCSLLLKTALLCLLLLGFSRNADATHFAAADMHVEYVGTSPTDYTYRVTLNIYKACEPQLDPITGIPLRDVNGDLIPNANLPGTANLEWRSSCFPNGNVVMNTPVIDTLDKLCDTFKALSSCHNLNATIFPSFVRHTFVTTVTLPGPCTDWVFFWHLGARNGAIRNLTRPDLEDLYVDAMINNSKTANINTPLYLVDPIPYYCKDAPAMFNNGPFDPDLDSMNSLNLNPRDAAGLPIGYRTAAGYSLVTPIDTKPTDPYKVDPNTCLATFTPTTLGKFALAFKTSKYDRKTGELMGYTTRDVQISVLPCESGPPKPDTPHNVSGAYFDKATSTLVACPGQELRFDVGALSQSLINAVYVRWDLGSLPGATYTSVGDGTAYAVGTLNWTPGKGDVGDHVINLKFIDSTCSVGQPLIIESYYVLRIKVLPYVNGGKDGIYCIPGGDGWKMQTTIYPGMRYKWLSIAGSGTTPPLMDDDTLASPTVRPAVNSTYTVMGTIGYGPYRCSTRDTVNVRIGVPLITIDAGPEQTICANTPISLKATVTPGSALKFVDWTPNYALSDTDKISPTATPSITTRYVLYAEDVNGCGFTDTTRVVVDGFKPLLDPFASRDTVCPEGSAQLYSNVSLQPCGIAQSSCSGGTPKDIAIGIGDIPSTMPSPFYHVPNSGGERMQILYRKDELLDAGIKPGFINSLAFNVPAKNTTDSFFKFTIKMACTPLNELTGSSMTSFINVVEVYPGKTIGTSTGWNTFEFPNAYYWDGASNLMVEVCWSKVYSVYGGSPDPVFTSNTSFTSVKYVGSYTLPATAMGDGCSVASPSITALLASNRPNTRFNVCSTPSLFKYSWTPVSYLLNPDSANTTVSGIKENTVYNVKVTASSNPNCFSDGNVSLVVDRTNSVEAFPKSPFVVCRPGYVTALDAEGRGPKPLQNIECGITDPIDCGGATSNAIVSDPANIGTIIAEPTRHAFNGAFTTAHTQYIIPRGSLLNGKITSGTIREIAIQSAGVAGMTFSNVKVSLKCTDLQQFPNVTPVPLETGTVNVFTGNLTVGGGGYTPIILTNPYNWDTTKNLLIDICYGGGTAGAGPTINNYSTPGFFLMAQANQTAGDICANPGPQNGPFAYELLPNFQITFCSAGDKDFEYTWTPGEFMEDTTVKKPTLYVGSSTKVYVSTIGRNGCVVRDSVSLFVPQNKRYVTRDTVICLNESINVRSYNGKKTVWYEGADYHKPTTLSCDDCEVSIAKPKEATDYYAAVTDEYDCVDTFRVHLDVKPLPTITIATQDTTIKYGSSVTLRAFGGTEYFWYPLAGLSMPNGVNPIAKPLVTTVYTVVGIGPNSCRGEDSVTVTVDYRAPLGIPSAFTPNGDGNNDIFRVAGVSFQTLMEFRVFNRWGQEVFSTNDIKGGWDGTYKGAAQDMGTYSYVIRIGYPDGKSETYKGDITLIR